MVAYAWPEGVIPKTSLKSLIGHVPRCLKRSQAAVGDDRLGGEQGAERGEVRQAQDAGHGRSCLTAKSLKSCATLMPKGMAWAVGVS